MGSSPYQLLTRRHHHARVQKSGIEWRLDAPHRLAWGSAGQFCPILNLAPSQNRLRHNLLYSGAPSTSFRWRASWRKGRLLRWQAEPKERRLLGSTNPRILTDPYVLLRRLGNRQPSTRMTLLMFSFHVSRLREFVGHSGEGIAGVHPEGQSERDLRLAGMA